HGPDDVARANGATLREPWRDRVEVTEEEQILAQAAAFFERVTRHDRVAEERARVNDLRVALLVIERDHRHGRAARLRDVEASVPDGLERPPATLRLVGPIEIVTGDDVLAARQHARDRISIRLVVLGSIRPARDLIVEDPFARLFAVGVL